MNYEIIAGDCLQTLKTLPANSVQMVCTSPPYFGLRDYGTATWEGGDAACDHAKPVPKGGKSTLTNWAGKSDAQEQYAEKLKSTLQYRDLCGKCGARRIDNQIGLEETPEAYVAKLVDVFREVRRVLRDDGTLWLNLGSSYAGGKKGSEIGANFPIVNMAGANEPFALRDDLTSDEVIYVLTELATFRQSVEVSEPNFAVGIDEAIASLASGEKV